MHSLLPAAKRESVTLTEELRARTHVLHARAEQTGIVRDILQGRASREGYCLLLRNLYPAYEAMEQGLERLRTDNSLRTLARPELYRGAALAADLEQIAGSGWRDSLPLLPSGAAYGRRIAHVAGDTNCLLGHAYVRYFGDLSGGQMLRHLLSRSLGLQPSALGFYAFPQIIDLRAFKADYRLALDAAIGDAAAIDAVADEACEAFALNIRISEAVREAVGR